MALREIAYIFLDEGKISLCIVYFQRIERTRQTFRDSRGLCSISNQRLDIRELGCRDLFHSEFHLDLP